MEKQAYSILIVDDQLENINQIISGFKANNLPYDTLLAFDGEMALKVMEKTMPDLIITDWEMPKMDGITFIKKVKENKKNQDIPIIMCTGVMTTAENLQTALNAGAVDYIKKPVNAIELTARVNSMLQLSNLYKQVKKQNEDLQLQKQEIQAQALQLKETNDVKDKLFSIVAHDLKNPISSLKGVFFLVEQGALSLEEISKLMSKIKVQVLGVEDMMTNLLLWARSQLSNINTEAQNFDMLKIIEENYKLIGKNAEAKNIELSHRLMPQTVLVSADINQTRVVMRNIIANAVKFTPQDGKIAIDAKMDGDFWQIEIQDTGMGMSEEEINKLFNIKTHFTKQGTSQEKGSGLGLLLCKEFVENNGGKIWVQSQVGKGTSFFFTVPVGN